MDKIVAIVSSLKSEYRLSDVTSGEFIHTIKLPSTIAGYDLTKEDVIQGIQEFLDWDDSPEEFDIIKFGNHWYTTEHYATYEDYYTFGGINYPTKILNVTIDDHGDDWMHSYLVTPESLLDAIEEYTGEINDERFYNRIDSEVYHYIEDQYWDEPNEVLAKKHLDLPMTLVNPEDYE